jgi:hypothetical protein
MIRIEVTEMMDDITAIVSKPIIIEKSSFCIKTNAHNGCRLSVVGSQLGEGMGYECANIK